MEHSKAVVAASSPIGNPPPLTEAESLLSALVYDVSQQVHLAMENMLKMTSEIDQSSCEIMEELEKCKESAATRKKNLEEEKECTQKAAYAVLEMLGAQGFS